jgi:hypothetical protein
MGPEPRSIRNRRGEREIALLLLVSIGGALGLAAVYWQGGQTQLEGLLLFVALAALAGALVLWAHRLLPNDPVVDPRVDISGRPADQAAVSDELDRD